MDLEESFWLCFSEVTPATDSGLDVQGNNVAQNLEARVKNQDDGLGQPNLGGATDPEQLPDYSVQLPE